ncbi:hypothetical protein Agub_g831 [Astrephomene gubernaculifera]|uniref:Uncharacterized protein n=1 Tax=Astrephomene gubernaculifera TaxID=47775 RepID=A0AAD3DEC1_9CHLO|nr:hypothetical protein Agub_g831 [Astrephomene gubernaculifera]
MSLLTRVAALSGLRRNLIDGVTCLTSARFHVGSQAATGSSSSTDPKSDGYGTLVDEVEDVAAIQRYREAKNFRRRVDGRVLLYGKENSSWMETKLDGYVEGALLLLGREGHVYYLVSEDLKQLDLTNDQLIGQLFGEGSWERIMQPLYTQTSDGGLKHVRMTRQQFRSIFTVMRETPQAEGDGQASSQ